MKDAQEPDIPAAKSFTAWRLQRTREGVRGGFAMMDETELDDGEVLIRVSYAALDTRDAWAAAGLRFLPSRLPCIGGKDLVGKVIASAAPRFQPGDTVLATGYGLGHKHHGAFAECALLPGSWILPLPAALTPLESMVLGTNGLAIAMALSRFEDLGLRPERGPVLVSDALDGRCELAVALCAARGYEVTVASRTQADASRFVEFGARRVLLCDELLANATRQKERALWAAAIDNLGGEVLAAIVATAKPGAGVAALGDGDDTWFSVPAQSFLQRGVSLFGVDAVQASFSNKEKAWARLAGDLLTHSLAKLCRVVAFAELPAALDAVRAGKMRGPLVVQIAAPGV